MIISARHRWSEAAGFSINRPAGIDSYTLLHFFGPVRLRVGDGACVTTHPDACILFAPHTPQWFMSDLPLLHDWMHLDASAQALLKRYSVPLDTIFYPPDSAFITSAVCEIELELGGSRPHRAELTQASAEMLLIRISRACGDRSGSCTLSPQLHAQLYRLRTLVLAQLDQAWTVEHMAAMLHMSPSHFHSVYRSYFDVSPMNDLIQARIDAAKSALTGSDISVARLAERLGYASVTHFSRQFRQRTGVSPRTYARQ